MAQERGAGRGLLARLKAGLRRTSNNLTGGIGAIFTGRRLDDAALEELEELLIAGDLGAATAAELTAELAQQRFGKEVTAAEVRQALADQIAGLLKPVEGTLAIDADAKPHVILVAGVNGTGKTTTIGKLAQRLSREGKRVMLVAGRYLSRRSRGAAHDLGRTRRGAPVVARAGRGRSRRPRLRRARARACGRHRRAPDRYRRPVAEQGAPDGRAAEDRPRAQEARRARAAQPPSGARTPPPARTRSIRSTSFARPSPSTAW